MTVSTQLELDGVKPHDTGLVTLHNRVTEDGYS